MYKKSINTILGIITIYASKKGITKITFNHKEETNSNSIIEACEKQLYEYLEGKRKIFEIPLDLKGTTFQIKVWKALLDTSYGEVKTYKKIAEEIGNPNAYRAVGNANNKNPIPIIIPCHRILGSNYQSKGYAYGKHIQKKLLEMEGVNYV